MEVVVIDGFVGFVTIVNRILVRAQVPTMVEFTYLLGMWVTSHKNQLVGINFLIRKMLVFLMTSLGDLIGAHVLPYRDRARVFVFVGRRI